MPLFSVSQLFVSKGSSSTRKGANRRNYLDIAKAYRKVVQRDNKSQLRSGRALEGL